MIENKLYNISKLRKITQEVGNYLVSYYEYSLIIAIRGKNYEKKNYQNWFG